MDKFDIGIIGSGPAGYTAALHAASKGKKIVLFEKDELGGVCLNKGCIPTKTIMHLSEIYSQMNRYSEFGISADNVHLDYVKVLERKNFVVEKLRNGLSRSMNNAKITIIKAQAEILSKNEITADGQTYICDEIICAAGSSPRIIKGLEFDRKFILSSDDILNLNTLPKSILIAGSGAIGCEWARIMANFGVETTVVEMAEHLLPLADIEVSKRVERIFKTAKINFYTNTSISKIEDGKAILSDGQELKPEKILIAAGRTPNKARKVEGVKYLGDMTGEILLAHFAIKEALDTVEDIPFRKDLTPAVIYGTPEIAWVGKREQDLESGTYQKSMLPVAALSKAHCDNETEGFIKLLVRDNKILGCHIVSKEASAMLLQVLVAMQNDITPDKLKEICFPHPAYSEGIFESLFRIN